MISPTPIASGLAADPALERQHAAGAAQGVKIQDVATSPPEAEGNPSARDLILRIRLSAAELARLKAAPKKRGLSSWARHVLLSAAAKRQTSAPDRQELHAAVCSRVWLGALLDELSRGQHDPTAHALALERAASLVHRQPGIFLGGGHAE